MHKHLTLRQMRRNSLSPLLAGLSVLALLSACQQTPSSLNSQSGSRPVLTQAPVQKPSSDIGTRQVSEAEDKQDIVGNLIAQIEEDAGTSLFTQDSQSDSGAAPQADEALTVASIPQDPEIEPLSQSGSETLDAALRLLKKQTKPQTKPASSYLLPAKTTDQIRTAVFVPLSGEYRSFGFDMVSGIDFALFQTGNTQIELVYFDTAGGLNAAQAAQNALDADIDIAIGPLFSASMTEIGAVMAEQNIPVLSLSNNLAAADAGRWVLGYLPEQQMDNLLAYAIEQNKTNIAILASQDSFGMKIREHVQKRLQDFGLVPANITILEEPVLADEDLLKSEIKRFTGYVPPTEDESELPPPLYDALVLAGNPDFILRTAPVLDYYDLGPSRVTYLGTDLWGRAELVSEPSLQGALVTQAELPDNQRFNSLWQRHFNAAPSSLSRLGFDVMAVVALTASQNSQNQASENGSVDWRRSLLRDKGFAGFSGRFSLLPDGRNQRSYTIRQIRDNRLNADVKQM